MYQIHKRGLEDAEVKVKEIELEVLERSVPEQMTKELKKKTDYKQRGSEQGRPKAGVSLPPTGDQTAGGRDSASPTEEIGA